MAVCRGEEKVGCLGELYSPHCPRVNEELRGLVMLETPRKNCSRGAAALTLFLLIGAASGQAQNPVAIQADVLIKNGHVIDGTGGPWIQANVAITGDKI